MLRTFPIIHVIYTKVSDTCVSVWQTDHTILCWQLLFQTPRELATWEWLEKAIMGGRSPQKLANTRSQSFPLRKRLVNTYQGPQAKILRLESVQAGMPRAEAWGTLGCHLLRVHKGPSLLLEPPWLSIKSPWVLLGDRVVWLPAWEGGYSHQGNE